MADRTNTRPATASIPPFGLRMQPDLKASLEQAAALAGRSLNSEIVGMLSTALVAGQSGNAAPVAAPVCEGCRFWHQESAGQANGECRRYPPTERGQFAVSSAAFVMTTPDKWCGEWQGRPTWS